MLLDAVIHGIAHDVHDRVADAVHDGLVDLGRLAHQLEHRLTVELLAHIAHDTLHFLEGRRDRHHAQRHRNVLERVGQRAQLPRRRCKVIQLEPLQVRRRGHHRLGDDDLAHHRHQRVQLAEVHADQAFLCVLRLRLLLGRARCRGRRRLLLRGLFRRRGFLRRRGLRRRGGRALFCRKVKFLIAAHGCGIGDDRHRRRARVRRRKPQDKAVFHNKRGRFRVGIHVPGQAVERARAQLPDGVDQHERAEVFHPAALVKEHLHRERELGAAKLRRACAAGRRGCFRRRFRLPAVFLLLDLRLEAAHLLKQRRDIVGHRLVVLDLLHLAAEKVDRLENQVEQLRAQPFRDDLHRLVADDEEQVLHAVRHRHQRIELHHRRGALKCVHDPEDLVYLVLRKTPVLLSR